MARKRNEWHVNWEKKRNKMSLVVDDMTVNVDNPKDYLQKILVE
jgi:hypothetical protein